MDSWLEKTGICKKTSPATAASAWGISQTTAQQRGKHWYNAAAPWIHAYPDPEGGIDICWILLDTQSTIIVFHAKFLRNICDSGHILHAITKGRHQHSHMTDKIANLLLDQLPQPDPLLLPIADQGGQLHKLGDIETIKNEPKIDKSNGEFKSTESDGKILEYE